MKPVLRNKDKANALARYYKSLMHAIDGIIYAIKYEHNMIIILAAAIVAVIAGLVFNISSVEWFFVILIIGLVAAAEMINTAIEATIDVAIAAAVNDPRFPQVTLDELKELDLEVTVLTKPEMIIVAHPDQYFEEIEIGRDGLIVQKGYSRGLLLPQVATENKFDVELFLEHTCMKAGISADSWMDESCDVYKFQGQIFE